MKGRKPARQKEDEQGRLGRKLAILRAARNKTQSQLARESGVKRASISQYEAELTTPDASTLERLLSALDFRWSALDLAGWFLAQLFSECDPSRGTACLDPDAGELEALAAQMTEAAGRLASTARSLRAKSGELPAEKGGASSEGTKGKPTVEDKAVARQIFDQACKLPPAKQLETFRGVPPGIRWAACELLCVESQRLCATNPSRGAALAELAIELADRVPGEEAWRSKLRGLGWAHVGNALRARGEDLQAAESAFSLAEGAWEAGRKMYPELIEEGLVYALKASLRRAQRRFPEAADLLERASAAAGGARFQAQILISRAKLAEELGDLELAVALLLRAGEVLVPDDDGRLDLCVRHNLADNLSKIDRFAEAAMLLPAVRQVCRRCGGEIDALRLLWIEGRVAAGLGRVEEGIATLSRVRGGFVRRKMGYDTALVSLELALLHAGLGRTDQVKVLARNMAQLFHSRDLHREALAALALFRQAAERENVTSELARKLLSYLRRARHDPELRFEGRTEE